jgi:exodeoxyribonuclease V beta subunit
VQSALRVHWINDEANTELTKEQAAQRATQVTVDRIVSLLTDSAHQICAKHESFMRPVKPSDIAVLVSTNNDVETMRKALARNGVPVSVGRRSSVYDSDAASDLLGVLYALLHPQHFESAQRASASKLLSESVEQLHAYTQGQNLDKRAQRFSDWRERWQRYGVLALINDCLSLHSASLSDPKQQQYAQQCRELGEELQSLQSWSLLDQYEYLLQCVHNKEFRDENPDQQSSISDGVQLLTVHKSKGLQFPVVFLPTLWSGKSKSANSPVLSNLYNDQDRRELLLTKTMSEAQKKNAEQEQYAEQRRQLYVALTRASHAVELIWGNINQCANTALFALLHGETKADSQAMRADLQHWSESSEQTVGWADYQPESDATTQRYQATKPLQHSIVLHRDCRSDWWVHSFSQLQRLRHNTVSAEEWRTDIKPGQNDFAGASFGLALHELFEQHSQWHEWKAAPALLQAAKAALRGQGFSESKLPAAAELCATLFRDTLHAALPEGVKLIDLSNNDLCPEMEFHFALRHGRSQALFDLLQQQGLMRTSSAAQQSALHGLMTGKIDLLYRYQDQYFIADFKSNWLPDYDQEQIKQSMLQHDYFMQALIYALAVHRWLRFRLGSAYSYQRDFGGIRYLYCRGMAETAQHKGVLAWKPDEALIAALEQCVDVNAQVAA